MKDYIKMQTKSTQRHKKAEYEGPKDSIESRLGKSFTLAAQN